MLRGERWRSAVVVTSADRGRDMGRNRWCGSLPKPPVALTRPGHDGADRDDLQNLGKDWLEKDDVDLYELNEAFSVQALGVMRELGLDPNKVNVNGGAVALGHPIGASGARVLVTLIYEMMRRDVHRGIAALCLGGGNAVAMAVER